FGRRKSGGHGGPPYMLTEEFMDGLLQGKTAIITGAGRGIGRAAAEIFASQGASVVVSDIDPAPSEEAVGAIIAAGGRALSVPGEVNDISFRDRLVTWASEKF